MTIVPSVFRNVPRALLAIALATVIPACGSFGGDDDAGVSAVPLLSGQGTWTPPPERVAQDLSTEPVAQIAVQGTTVGPFSSADGTIYVQVQLTDASGRLIIEEVLPESFSIGLDSLTLTSSASGGESVVSAEPSEVAIKPPTTTGLTGILLFDSSGSTYSTDRARYRVDAAQAFVAEMPEGTQLAIMDFGVANGGVFGRRVVSEGFDQSRLLSDFSSDRDALAGAIARVTSSGGTPMYAALRDALRALETVRQQGADEQFLIVFTDGAAGDYDAPALNQVVARANALSAPVHTVALDGGGGIDDGTLARLQSIASGTGGLSFSASTAEQLVAHFQQLAAAVAASVTVAVDVKFSNRLPSGRWTLSGRMDADMNGAVASTPFTVEFSVE